MDVRERGRRSEKEIPEGLNGMGKRGYDRARLLWEGSATEDRRVGDAQSGQKKETRMATTERSAAFHRSGKKEGRRWMVVGSICEERGRESRMSVITRLL